jgi:hypothetical protein
MRFPKLAPKQPLPGILSCLLLAVIGCGSSATILPDFSISATPSTISLTAGAASQQVTVTTTALTGFKASVAVVLAGLPTGVTAAPSSFTLTPGIPQTITLSASATAPASTTTLTFTATSGTLSHTATFTLTVAAAPQDFSLAVNPSTLNITGGAAGASTSLSVTAINGFTSGVAVAITGLPSGITATPSSPTVTPGTSQNITFTAASTVAASSNVITFTGTSGSLSHTTTLTLNIAATPPPPDFSLAVNPTTLNITGGAAGASTSLSVTAINGFTSGVAIAITGLPTGITATPPSPTVAPGTPQNITFTAASTAAASSGTITFTGTSGSLSHTTTLKLNVTAAPAPDFTLSINPTSLNLTTGALGQATAVSAVAVNGFASTISISLSALPAGVTASPATLTLTPGTPQSITLTAAANATLGTSNVSVIGQSGSLSHTATLGLTVAVPAGNDAVTYHYDNGRTGLNPNETILNTTNVASATFGKLNLLTLDGRVDAEPLYLSAVTLNGQTHNVLYVVTEHDSIYALDADNGTQLWKVSALGTGETTSDDHGCGQITPEIGITSTPVIDRRKGTNGTIFIVAMTKDSKGVYHQRLHALDITTGAETTGSPSEIAGTYPGTGANSSGGNVIFAPGQYAERAGLLLMNQTVYLGWTSHCDAGPYTGWIMGYSENTLQQTAILNLTPNGSEGAIWMAGAGLAGDTSGNIYFLDANGTLDAKDTVTGFPVNNDFGNAMVKLSTANNSLAVDDFFETYDSINESNNDIDLGSGGALLLPDLTDASNVVHHLIVGAGKDSNIYVGDRDNLGRYSPTDNTALYQELTNALPSGAWSMPAYFNNTVYYGGVGDNLKAFTISNATLGIAPSSKSATTFGYPGATPSVSANGTSNGIVWALESGTGSAAVLHAYDATNLTKELYNSNQAAANRDSFGNGNKFLTPMIINGKVYVGTPSGVAIFGILP